MSPFDEELPAALIALPARAVVDTALTCPDLRSARALIASAVQRQRCTVAELDFELTRVSRRGSGYARVALAEVADGARSVAEAEALARLKCAPVPPFEPNVPIVDQHGRLIAVADVLWRELRAVLEIDSREYHFAEADWASTMDRHNLLARAGLTLTHYPPSRIRADDSWVAEVMSWLDGRAAELGVPPRSGPKLVASGDDLRVVVDSQPRLSDQLWTPRQVRR